MALSRPYLGVHYPSDVVAGALLGDVIGRLAAR
jgi:membrane-associated phospholipid phosphatase